jgi:hypothetical protein
MRRQRGVPLAYATKTYCESRTAETKWPCTSAQQNTGEVKEKSDETRRERKQETRERRELRDAREETREERRETRVA